MRLFNNIRFRVFYHYLIFFICLANAAVVPDTPDTKADPEITDLLILNIHQATSKDDTTSKPLGTIVIGLFGNIVPKTVDNFKQLANIYSKNHTPFHRVIPGFVIQGGDIDGKGGHSIYGEKGTLPPEGANPALFGPGYSGLEDENFELHHDKIGRVSVANAGPSTGGSQFFICLNKLPHLDGHHVVFGQVLKGIEVATDIANVKRDRHDKPIEEVFIQHAEAREYTDEINLEELSNVVGIVPISLELDDPQDDPTHKSDEDIDPQGTPKPEVDLKESVYSKNHPTGLGGSQNHYVFIPFIIFIAAIGFMAVKNKRNIAASIRGPRYRRV